MIDVIIFSIYVLKTSYCWSTNSKDAANFQPHSATTLFSHDAFREQIETIPTRLCRILLIAATYMLPNMQTILSESCFLKTKINLVIQFMIYLATIQLHVPSVSD